MRELTDLLNSYQQKISIFNEETDILKNQLNSKDRELDQLKIQLKNLKRSKSSEPATRKKTMSSSKYFRQLISIHFQIKNKIFFLNKLDNRFDMPAIDDEDESQESSNRSNSADQRSKRSLSAETINTETLARQIEIGNDEVKLLRNKIARLEDDLQVVTQVNF